MFIVQNEDRPAEMQNAIFDLLRDGALEVRICSAYVSLGGSQLIHNAIQRAAGGDDARITVVASLDYGITESRALKFWMGRKNCALRLAGVRRMLRGSLLPSTAFHPKMYIVENLAERLGTLVGSANLTNRGFTTNSEVGWLQTAHREREHVDQSWSQAIQGTEEATVEVLDKYHALKKRVGPKPPVVELEPVPPPRIERPQLYDTFANAHINPQNYSQFWIQSNRLQGGARTQLELPRGSHRFFGANYSDYDYDRVEHIAEPILISGRRTWKDRPLTWHGDNAMERINLPSVSMGGFDYEHSLILFRRVAANTFELRAYPWADDSAHAIVEASLKAGLVFRVGRNSNRLAGFLP
jgi:HKD family nuclease